MINITTKDINNTNEVFESLYKGIDQGLTKSAMYLRDQVKPITPVDTGRLKKSMKYERVEATMVRVTADPQRFIDDREPYYAWYVEFGTVKMAPRAMIRRGFDENVDEVYNRFVKEINNSLQ